MTYFGCDLKHLRAPVEPRRSFNLGEHLVGGFLVAVALLILGGYIK